MEMPRLGVVVPDRVMEQGQALLDQHADFDTADLWDYEDGKLFWIATLEQRKRLIEAHLAKLRTARREIQYQYGGLCSYISQSGLPVPDRLALYRSMADIAEFHANPYLQERVASSVVRIDAPLAIRTIWNVLPEDRDSASKARPNIDHAPPQDAGDAIRCLQREIKPGSETAVEAGLIVALWDFLPTAPRVDQDGIRLALCGSMIRHGHFNLALGLVEQIEGPVVQAKARLQLLRQLR